MPKWALQFGPHDIAQLAALWSVPGVEALHHELGIWVRGLEPDDATRRLLATVPCVNRFEVLPDDSLLRPGHLVPRGYLPTGHWLPLKKFLTVTLPSSGLPARKNARVPVRLVPSAQYSEPDILLTDLTSWLAYVSHAPQVRLKVCQFAVAGDGRVLVQGSPLPPINGTRAVARYGLVVPCGWAWTPAVDASLLARAWGVEAGDLWLLWPGREVERIRADQLVVASRSAVELSREAVSHARIV